MKKQTKKAAIKKTKPQSKVFSDTAVSKMITFIFQETAYIDINFNVHNFTFDLMPGFSINKKLPDEKKLAQIILNNTAFKDCLKHSIEDSLGDIFYEFELTQEVLLEKKENEKGRKKQQNKHKKFFSSLTKEQRAEFEKIYGEGTAHIHNWTGKSFYE